jgi:hypothetical protein
MVPRFVHVIDEVVRRIQDRSIVEFGYDPESVSLRKRESLMMWNAAHSAL